MKQLNEIKRLQQLAGINEIRVNRVGWKYNIFDKLNIGDLFVSPFKKIYPGEIFKYIGNNRMVINGTEDEFNLSDFRTAYVRWLDNREFDKIIKFDKEYNFDDYRNIDYFDYYDDNEDGGDD
jgi:hypothetical protein